MGCSTGSLKGTSMECATGCFHKHFNWKLTGTLNINLSEKLPGGFYTCPPRLSICLRLGDQEYTVSATGKIKVSLDESTSKSSFHAKSSSSIKAPLIKSSFHCIAWLKTADFFQKLLFGELVRYRIYLDEYKHVASFVK